MGREAEFNIPEILHFNELSPAEAERLAILIEEMGEAIQAACKVLRHGYESVDPTAEDGGIANRLQLAIELGHVGAALEMMVEEDDLSEAEIERAADKKRKSIQRWLHHQIREINV